METIIVFKRRHFSNSSHIHNGQAHYQLVEKPPAQLGALHPKGFSNENIHHCIYEKKKKKTPYLRQIYKNSISSVPITTNED